MNQMWMVRAGHGGQLAEEYRAQGVVAIGWGSLGDLSGVKDRAEVIKAVRDAWPDWSKGRVINSASQLARFVFEVEKGDRVITYDGSRRVYHVGTVAGDYRYEPGTVPPYENVRPVEWDGEIERDRLSTSARNTLGSTLTLFRLPSEVAEEIENTLRHAAPAEEEEPGDAFQEEGELLEDQQEKAFEFIKDQVGRLDWEQLEQLVAGVLRAMGYKTRLSPFGPDRGKDIVASPDGFGLESPRIVVEVKHRGQPMSAQDIRSFLGGRHREDKGLYVSTGGFTKDAYYEAERASIPVELLDLNGLVQALIEHYDSADSQTRSLLPLVRIYWPAGRR